MIHKYRLLMLTLFSVFILVLGFTMLIAGTAQAQSLDAIDIVNEINPEEANEEQIEAVENFLFSQGDDLDDDLRNAIGQWLTDARQSDSPSESNDNTVDDVTSDVVANINDNLTLRDYDFDRDAGTVTLIISADRTTERVTLTDPQSAGDTGVGDVTQRGITVPSGESVEVEFSVGYSQYTGSATVWISAGAGDTIYVSNDAQELINRLEWGMIPAAGFAGAMAVFLSGLIYVYRKYSSLNKSYNNVFREI